MRFCKRNSGQRPDNKNKLRRISTPKEKTIRIYQITEKGKQILKKIKTIDNRALPY
jgi:predicted transcriptional regulator